CMCPRSGGTHRRGRSAASRDAPRGSRSLGGTARWLQSTRRPSRRIPQRPVACDRPRRRRSATARARPRPRRPPDEALHAAAAFAAELRSDRGSARKPSGTITGALETVRALGRGAVEPAEPEVPETETLAAEMRLAETRPVDEIRDPILQTVEHLRLLSLRQAAGRHRLVELLLGRSDQRRNQAVRRLALVLRDVGEALAVLELGLELGLRETEVVRRGIET